jgi:shikimate kinase
MTDGNLFLIGLRGTGKSTVARLVAKQLQWQAVDADQLLEERAGRSIRQIFADDGETTFRDLESSLLAELCTGRRQVIATGGGVVLREPNRRSMRAAGRAIWLTADVDTLWQRLQADTATAERRPALTDRSGRDEIDELARARAPLYRECADWTIDTTGLTPVDIAARIVALVSQG